MTLHLLSREKIRLAPFVWTALGWGVVSTLVVLGFTPDPYFAFASFGILFVLCVLDLFFLVKTVAVILELVSYQGAEKQTRHAIRLAFWASAKFFTLAVLVVIVWKARGVPVLSWSMGIGTLIVVPLLGGLWWSSGEQTQTDPKPLQKQKRDLLHV